MIDDLKTVLATGSASPGLEQMNNNVRIISFVRHDAARRTQPDHRSGLEGRRPIAELIRPTRRRGEAGIVSSAVASSQRPYSID
jgi:hypothetical protein